MQITVSGQPARYAARKDKVGEFGKLVMQFAFEEAMAPGAEPCTWDSAE